MTSMRILTERSVPESGVLCVSLAHNEAKRVADFLRHHRELGVAHFLILDDDSGDGTRDYLAAQADVSLFAPNGTNYKQHKVAWRKDILDRYASGRWALVPDLDELFVFPHCDRRAVGALADHLDREGAEAVFAPMVEMYADAPLDQTVYEPGQSMLAAFPYFDADGYRLVEPRRKRLRKFPTPPLDLYGGPRERLFYDFRPKSLRGLRALAVRRLAGLERSMRPGFWERRGNLLARLALQGKAPYPPLIISKVVMVRWRQGLRFPGGPHSVSQNVTLSELWGALLHFKFIDLPFEASYRAARQQHAGNGLYYKHLERKSGFERSPIYPGSRRYESWRDLLDCGLLRTTPDWDREDGVPYRPPARNRTPAEA